MKTPRWTIGDNVYLLQFNKVYIGEIEGIHIYKDMIEYSIGMKGNKINEYRTFESLDEVVNYLIDNIQEI